ncbi:hypothetical protein ACWDZ4_13655 [Streptomyces sp. NPDC003016]
MQSGTALGVAMASLVFFNHAPAGSHGTTAADAFAGSIRYVIAALAVISALMFRRPKPALGHVAYFDSELTSSLRTVGW